MTVEIKLFETTDENIWNNYVSDHPQASVYHQLAWGRVVQQAYGHSVYNLMAVRSYENEAWEKIFPEKEGRKELATAKSAIVGILPLVQIKHFLFGSALFSLPFADLGGILADDAEVEKALIFKAAEVSAEHNIPTIELRQTNPLPESVFPEGTEFKLDVNVSQQTAKVRMLLDLPDSSKQLMESFKAKLRSQIRRPQKDGLFVQHGGIELLDHFYAVFAENMRDLGSPVHSKVFIGTLMREYASSARIFVVYKENQPLASSFTLGFKKTLSNPWASSLRRFSRLSPNMLLYWAMLEYACDNGYATFDFGRSTLDEGTYKFKKQWGAIEKPLHWLTFSNQPEKMGNVALDKSKYDLAMRIWKKLPVSISKTLGPSIRKNIGL